MSTIHRNDHESAAIINLAVLMPSKREAGRLLAAYRIPIRTAVRVLTTPNRRQA